jgi:hypothetical protein
MNLGWKYCLGMARLQKFREIQSIDFRFVLLEALSKITCVENVRLSPPCSAHFSSRRHHYDPKNGLKKAATVPTLRWDKASIFIRQHF